MWERAAKGDAKGKTNGCLTTKRHRCYLPRIIHELLLTTEPQLVFQLIVIQTLRYLQEFLHLTETTYQPQYALVIVTCLGLADEDNSDDGNEVDDDDDDESDEDQEVIIAAKHLEKEVRKCLSLGQ